MAHKKLIYVTLDCETAGNDFTMEFTAEQRKTVNLVKSLIYDIGWVKHYRNGEVIVKRSFLVSEIFCVPSVFCTAYYADKRPQYLQALENGEIELRTWKEIMKIFEADMKDVDYFGAYNAQFDCRAMNYTDLYVRKLYAADFMEWREKQKQVARNMIAGVKYNNEKKDMDNFCFRGKKYPLYDIWRMSCESLINNHSYKRMCLDNGMLSESGMYFKTSAESSYRYLRQEQGFEEAHTALADAEIETEILVKILKRKAVTVGLGAFPFRELGKVTDYLVAEKDKGRLREKDKELVIQIMTAKIESYGNDEHSFRSQLENAIEMLEQL